MKWSQGVRSWFDVILFILWALYYCYAVAYQDNSDASMEHAYQIIECVMGEFIALMGQMRRRKFVRSMNAEMTSSVASMADVCP